MKPTFPNRNLIVRVCVLCAITWACLSPSGRLAAQRAAAKSVPHPTAAPSSGARSFGTPQQAADVLVSAAEKFDVVALTEIFGPDGNDIVFSGEFAQDRK